MLLKKFLIVRALSMKSIVLNFCLSALLMALVGMHGCTKSQQPLLRVASNIWPGYETLYLARSLGYYDENRIRLVEMGSASQVSHALRNGMVEAACLTLDETISLIQDGVELRAVLVMDVSHGADVLLARPGFNNLHSLRGHRVGVENTAVGAIMLDAALEAGGITAEDVVIVPLTVDEHDIEYLAGRVDAVVTFEPVRSRLLKSGSHVLFDSSRIPGRIVDVLVVRSDTASVHAGALKILLEGHFRAIEYIVSEPADAEKRMEGRLNAGALAQFQGLTQPDLNENRAMLGGDSPRLIKTSGELAGFMFKRRLLQRPVSVDRIADASFLPETAE